MEARAVARYVRVSPRKTRAVVDLIRGKGVGEADAILRFSPRAAAEIVDKVLNSAVANAEKNLRIRPETLFVSQAFVDEGPTLKRIKPRAMGRAYRINKRTSHITVVVAPAPQVATEKSVGPAEKMAATPQAMPRSDETQNFVYASKNNGGSDEATPDDDQDDLEATLAKMTPEEKEALKAFLAEAPSGEVATIRPPAMP